VQQDNFRGYSPP